MAAHQTNQLDGAVRPKPAPLAAEAFGGNFNELCLRQEELKKEVC
jgi:hypothetical protein